MRAAAFVVIGAALVVALGVTLYAFLHYRYTTGLSSPGWAVLTLALIGAAAGRVAYRLMTHKPAEKPE